MVITGANRGIGAALADRYRAANHQVTATSRQGSGPNLDVSSAASINAFAASLAQGSVDLLVCNAGVYLDRGQDLDTGFAADAWAHTFAVNVTGVFLTVQALLPALRRAKGKIAIISSQMASHTRAPGGSYIYRASKAAALNVGRNLATDLKSDGIAVGIYHPGWVQTDMGGTNAATTLDDSADGLVARFAELNMATTGCFRTFDGHDHPY